MKYVLIVALVSVLLAAASCMQDVTSNGHLAVRQTAMDYVEGIYEVKPEYIQRSVHENLTKVGFARDKAEEAYETIPMTKKQLVRLAGHYNADGHIASDAPKKVEILDVLDQTASVKLTAEWGVDYLHMARYIGKWKIIHVIWQSHPMEDDEK